jgi:hypothetical protein
MDHRPLSPCGGDPLRTAFDCDGDNIRIAPLWANQLIEGLKQRIIGRSIAAPSRARAGIPAIIVGLSEITLRGDRQGVVTIPKPRASGAFSRHRRLPG